MKKKKPQITQITLIFLFFLIICVNLCNLWAYFHSNSSCYRALTRKRMKTDTNELRSIEAPLAEGEEE